MKNIRLKKTFMMISLGSFFTSNTSNNLEKNNNIFKGLETIAGHIIDYKKKITEYTEERDYLCKLQQELIDNHNYLQQQIPIKIIGGYKAFNGSTSQILKIGNIRDEISDLQQKTKDLLKPLSEEAKETTKNIDKALKELFQLYNADLQIETLNYISRLSNEHYIDASTEKTFGIYSIEICSGLTSKDNSEKYTENVNKQIEKLAEDAIKKRLIILFFLPQIVPMITNK